MDNAPRLGEKTLARLIKAERDVRWHPVVPNEGIESEHLFLLGVGGRGATRDALGERDRSRTQPATEINNRAFFSRVARRALAEEGDFVGRDHSGRVSAGSSVPGARTGTPFRSRLKPREFHMGVLTRCSAGASRQITIGAGL